MPFNFYDDSARVLIGLSDEDAGKVVRAIMQSNLDGIEPKFDGLVMAVYALIKGQIDRAEEIRELRSNSGRRGSASKHGTNVGKPEANPSKHEANVSSVTNTVTEAVTSTVSDTVAVLEKETESGDKGGMGGKENAGSADASPIAPADAVTPLSRSKQKAVSHQCGEYGWVKLTDGEYTRLIDEYGESKVRHYIRYVDESAQQTNNKNKWRDWNLTVRKAIREGWGPRGSPPAPSEEKIKYVRARPEEISEAGEYLTPFQRNPALRAKIEEVKERMRL